MTKDLLRLDLLSALPQPITATLMAGGTFTATNVDVSTGIINLDVNGSPGFIPIARVRHFTDGNGAIHHADAFYTDFEPLRA